MLHNDVKAGWCLNNLVHLDDVGVADNFQNVELTCHSLNIRHLNNLVLHKNLNCDFLPRKEMNTFFNFSEGALAQCFGHHVAANNLLMRQESLLILLCF